METIDKNQTIDETKRKLQASREQLEGQLEVQLQDIKKDAVDFGKQVLLIGGGIYLGYRLLKSLTSSSKKEKKRGKVKRREIIVKKKQKGPGIGQMLAQQVLTMAVAAMAAKATDALKQKQSVNDRKKYS